MTTASPSNEYQRIKDTENKVVLSDMVCLQVLCVFFIIVKVCVCVCYEIVEKNE